MRRALPPLCVLLLPLACHPLSLYVPPDLPPKLKAAGLQAKVEILIDGRGVPHIYGVSLSDVSYGLGFMHARDRLFHVILLQHASQGRLAELFGEDLLATDKRLRLVSWQLDQHVAALAENDRRVLDAYARGLSDGAKHAGQSAEMALLRVEPPQFTARDALGIMRLQAWQLSMDHIDEIVRRRLLEKLPPGDLRRAFIDAPVTSGGVSITGAGETQGAELSISPGGDLAASNSWAVDAAHTASGHAVLANDPHLGHMAPGVFYLAHLETPDFTVAGATLPGGPIVAIGFGKHVAWGMTVSYADAQDLLVIKRPPGRDDVYEVDSELVPFERVEQTFVVGKGKKTITETWLGTRFGPLLPPGYPGARADDPLALHWGALQPGENNAQPVTGFVELAASRDAAEAGRAVEKIRGSGQNVLLAFTDGSIAYRLAAMTPRRPGGDTGRLPRDGSRAASAFSGFLSLDEQPQVTKPKSGYLVAANQRVVGDDDARVASVGTTAVPPSRAQRIHERIDSLLARPEKPTVDDLLAIQQDVRSVEAQAASQRLGALCPTTSTEAALCDAVRRFDGTFSTDSLTALPYALLLEAVSEELVRAFGVTDEELVPQVARSIPLRNALGRALLSTHPQILLDAPLMERAARHAREQLEKRAGKTPADWRYGKLHTLQPKGALAKAPLFGGFFTSEAHEEPGDSTAVRAEAGLPVTYGACLRMIVELSDPPVARLTLDTGQSGHPRNPHYMDQYEDWSKGAPRKLPTVRSEVESAARERIELLP
jgi:penicillin amidase